MVKNKKPIRKIPNELIDTFTTYGKSKLIYEYSDDSDQVAKYEIREENIRMMVEKIKNHETFPLSEDGMMGSSYENIDRGFYKILDSNNYDIQGKNILIIGTTNGWFESVVLAYGGIPHVVDYVDVEYDGEIIKFYKPEELSKLDFKFDFCVSFSSYEHDGLGRYGDPINPDGDLKSMKGLKTIMKSDGILFLAVPIGLDKVVFNLHRIYGKARLPLLFQEWKLLGSSGWWWDQLKGDFGCGHQPIFVLQNTDNKKYNTNYYKNLFKFGEIAMNDVVVY